MECDKRSYSYRAKTEQLIKDGFIELYLGEWFLCAIWWLNNIGIIGEHIFSFDKEKLYNVFVDYPDNLTPEER